jgi:glycosyltransferase involved in cell wall biosynthesis
MKIGVNSRIFLEKGTGLPNYVAGLYRKCLELDRANEYVFFQPSLLRTLGRTESLSTPPGPLGAAVFDCLRVQRLIRRAKPDIFHAPAHILPAGKIAGVKYVVTIHDLAIRIMPSQYDWKLRYYYRWRLPRSLKLADMIVAVSHNTKEDIMRLYGVPAERIQVVHLGVADRFLKPAGTFGERLIEQKYFLSLTTHPRRKNILGVLKAFATFAGRCNCKYVIAGVISAEQQRELLACASDLGIRGQTILFGYADDNQLINLYRNAEFLIYPSFYEGFGLPVLEAMASRCPVIASNTSSLPEIMPDKQWLVDPHSLADMAGAMQRMLVLPQAERDEMIEQNEKHARNFTWEKAARDTMQIFRELALDGTSSR